MSCRLHVKICEAKKLIRKTDLFASLQLNDENQKTEVIVNTQNPIWNQEFDIISSDPNDILRINMYEEGVEHDIKMMDELKFPVSNGKLVALLITKNFASNTRRRKLGN